MNTPRLRGFRFAAAAIILAIATSLAAPGASEKQTAEAAAWKMYLSNTEAYCEGCCPQGYLCCNVNFPCRVTAVAEPG